MARKSVGGGGQAQDGASWAPAVRLVFRLLGAALAILTLLALISYHPSDPQPFISGTVSGQLHNWCGSAGAFVAGALQTLAGWGSLLVPFYLAWECWPHAEMGTLRRWLARLSWAVGALSAWVLLGALPSYHWTWADGAGVDQRWGGWMGALLWPKLRLVFGPVGLPVLLAALLTVSAFVIEPVLTAALGRLVVRFFGEKAWPFLRPMPAKGVRGFLTMARKPFQRQDDLDELHASDLVAIQDQERRDSEMEIQRESLIRAEMEAADLRKKGAAAKPESLLPAIHSMHLDPSTPATIPPIESMQIGDGYRSKLLQQAPPPKAPKPTVEKPQVMRDRYGREMVQQPLPLTEPTPNRPLPALPEPKPKPQPAIDASMHTGENDQLPPRRLFDPPQPHGRVDPAALEDIKARIGAKLAEFKIKGAVTGVQPGPVVTVFEFQPDAGIPLSRILGMEEDLALALQAEAVRMDRIPGKNLVGIEVPNARREIIAFREVLDAPAFLESPGLLNLALGKDMAGHPVVADLAKMPHLLIGGSTGSGKSVGVNAMISSVLLRARPDEAKLILIDPKMVEMGVYEDIPHLWAPVVTDMKEAGRVLKWVVAQMEDRYRRLTLVSARDIESFNRKVKEAGGRIDLSARTPNPKWIDRPKELEALPFVVVVIDELADLMMVARSEVEESIARIAQKARAVGIHMVLATQRPSVDVITGVIKANLPARLSYRVNSKIDSRTILDGGGGEQLLGKGDGLFLAPGTSRPKRIHAPYLTEEETGRLVAWLKERGKPDYNQALIQAMETDEADETALLGEGDSAGGDDIYVKAVAVVVRERKASTSLLQRKLNLGYGRAARLIDKMEEEGIIGPDRGAGKPREVLVDQS